MEKSQSVEGGKCLSGGEKIAWSMALFVSAIIGGVVLYYCRFGIDLSDEGFYLNSIAYPARYQTNIPPSLFGFVYHPLYVSLAGDIELLRVANVLLTMTIGLGLCFLVVRRFWSGSILRAVAASAGLSVSSFLIFRTWLVTPNYNSLNLQALMVICSGLLMRDVDGPARKWIASLLVGGGGWLCFMAKPTTAVGVGILVVVHVVLLSRRDFRFLSNAAAVAAIMLLATAFTVGGGVGSFVERILASVKAVELLGSGQDFSHIFRIDRLAIGNVQLVVAVGLGLLPLVAAVAVDKASGVTMLLLSVVSMTAAAVSTIGQTLVSPQPAILLIAPVAAVFSASVYRLRLMHRSDTKSTLSWTALFLVLPYLFAFGTNGNYWVAAADAGLFWLLAAVFFIGALLTGRPAAAALLGLTAISQIFAAGFVDAGLQSPYRQVRDVRSYHTEIPLKGQRRLILSQSFQYYFSDALRQAGIAGLPVGAPIIDLSGRSPTLLYILGARALGQPWLVGRYPGSDQVAIMTLAEESCEDLAIAWLLTEPSGPRHLDTAKVLASFGAKEGDYRPSGSFSTPVNDGDYPDSYRQTLLRPIRPVQMAVDACTKTLQAAYPGD